MSRWTRPRCTARGTYGYAIIPVVTIQGVTDDGKPLGPVLSEQAMIDSGSSDTVIDPGVVTNLSLTQVGITTAVDGQTGTRVDAATYRVCLTIPRLGRQWGDLYAPVRSLALPKPSDVPMTPRPSVSPSGPTSCGRACSPTTTRQGGSCWITWGTNPRLAASGRV